MLQDPLLQIFRLNIGGGDSRKSTAQPTGVLTKLRNRSLNEDVNMAAAIQEYSHNDLYLEAGSKVGCKYIVVQGMRYKVGTIAWPLVLKLLCKAFA